MKIGKNQIKDLILQMYDCDRIQDLIDLLSEDSPYTSQSMENLPKTKQEIEFCAYALHHLQFVIISGQKHCAESYNHKEKSYYSCYLEFREWLNDGCKGIVPLEINEYLQHHPI